MKKKMTFALCFGNRGFMPGELILGARDDMVKAVTDAGYDYIMMEESASRYGAWKPATRACSTPRGSRSTKDSMTA